MNYPQGPLVIKQSRTAHTDEPTGEAESLWGRIDPKEMGTRYKPLKAPIGAPSSASKQNVATAVSKSVQVMHDSILAIVRQALGDLPNLAATAQDLISFFASRDSMPNVSELSEFLGCTLSPDHHGQMVSLISQLPKATARPTSEPVSVLFEASSSESDLEEAEEEAGALQSSAAALDSDTVDIDMLAFAEGSRLMTNAACALPDGTERSQLDGYEEVRVPAPSKAVDKDETLITVADLPKFLHAAFSGKTHLNRVQSRACSCALGVGNMLVCAPTGSGKTNVALLAILNGLQRYGPKCKALYVAPMKALCSEMADSLGRALKPYNLQVSELTGDSTLSKQQLADSFLLVCTPEKLDIITRKISDSASDWFMSSIRTVIMDEIHLLHDIRGPVLECLIARFKLLPECRLVGLSATLPNYQDVAAALGAEPETTFFFDASYRPVPLSMQYCAVSERRPIQRLRVMDRIVVEKIQQRPNQTVLVFVHSRKEASRTARLLAESLKLDSRHLESDAARAQSLDLREALSLGIGFHHAGLSRADRSLVETLFSHGRISVLVSTATLAWGVNLPARTVIIKGTDVYSPEKSAWVELSPQDTLQMLGRAGRPQYDSSGEGIIITTGLELQFYMSLTTLQLPIESQLIGRFVDCINAEVVNGTVNDKISALAWFQRTYLSVRMQRQPLLYGNQLGNLPQRLIHSAFSVLDKEGLLAYDVRSGHVQPTPLGRITAHFYLTWRTVGRFASAMLPQMTDIDLLRAFGLADEFRHLMVRSEEKVEIAKLTERVPIPIKESPDDRLAKISALLQCYVSRVTVEGLALLGDMSFISGSAARLFRAMYEIAISRGWAQCAHLTLDFCKMIEQRQWRVESPLRQFASDNTADWLRKLERKDFPFERLFDLEEADLASLMKQSVPELSTLLRSFPRVHLEARVKPRRSDLLQIIIHAECLSEQSDAIPWSIFVEDVNRATILEHRIIKVSPQRPSTLKLLIPHQSKSPVLFVVASTERFLGTDRVQPVNLMKITMPLAEDQPDTIADIRPIALQRIISSADKSVMLSVSLTQSLPALHKSFVYSAGADFDMAKEICFAQGYHTDDLRLFDFFDFRTEVSVLRELVSNSHVRLCLLLRGASNVKQLAEWMQAQVAINFTADMLPVESELLEDQHLSACLLIFAAEGVIRSKSDAIGLLSRSFLYRRLLSNPYYYGCPQDTDLSEFLSGHVDDALGALAEGGFIEAGKDGNTFKPTSIGIVAAKHAGSVGSASIEMFALSLTPDATLTNLIDLVSASDEMDALDLEDEARAIYSEGSINRIPSVCFNDPHHQAKIILEAIRLGLDVQVTSGLTQTFCELLLALEDVANCLGFDKSAQCAELLEKLRK